MQREETGEEEERSQLLWIYGFTCAGDNDDRKSRPRVVGKPTLSRRYDGKFRMQNIIHFVAESGAPESFDDFLCDLLVANWTSPGGPWRLSTDLSLADLGTAAFFLNARLFLTAIVEENGASATATGNLNRAFVGRMCDRLELPSLSRQSIRRCCKVLNEHDLWALHSVRLVSQCARLVARRKKRFQVTKAGRALLPDGSRGVLHNATDRITVESRYDYHHLQNFGKTECPIGGTGSTSPRLEISDSARSFGEQDEGDRQIGHPVGSRSRQTPLRKSAWAERPFDESQASQRVW